MQRLRDTVKTWLQVMPLARVFPWARVLIIHGGAPLAVERHQGQNGANESSKGRGISDGTFQGV